MANDSLGAFQREYSAAASGRQDVITGSVILVVLAAVGSVMIIFAKPGQRVLAILLLAGLVGATAGVLLVPGIRKLGRRILFHADGMILHDGGNRHVIRWDEVAALTGGVPISFRGTPTAVGGPLQIDMRDGRRFRLVHGYADPEVLYHLVNEKVMAHLVPSAVAALQRGETLTLGPLRMDRAGIQEGNKSLPWSELQGVSFTPDDLVLTRAGTGQPWAALKIARVPNANLFLHLARARQQWFAGR